MSTEKFLHTFKEISEFANGASINESILILGASRTHPSLASFEFFIERDKLRKLWYRETEHSNNGSKCEIVGESGVLWLQLTKPIFNLYPKLNYSENTKLKVWLLYLNTHHDIGVSIEGTNIQENYEIRFNFAEP